jgi:hypothetical protein
VKIFPIIKAKDSDKTFYSCRLAKKERDEVVEGQETRDVRAGIIEIETDISKL